MPFERVPVIDIDGVKYTNAIAILAFLAKKYNLNGSSDLEALAIEGSAMTIYDLLGSK